MKKRNLSAIKLFFLFATVGAFPFLYPAMQFQQRPMSLGYDRSFDVRLNEMRTPTPIDTAIFADKSERQKPSMAALKPIDPALGSEAQPDPIE